MGITILGEQLWKVDRGWEVTGTFQFSTTSLTGYLPINSKCEFILGGIQMWSLGATSFGGTYALQDGTSVAVSASAAYTMIVPTAGVITSAGFVVDTTVATDAANIWTIGIINTTASLAAVDIADATNSNNSTGGTAFTADTLRALTVSATAANLVVNAGDILEWTFTKASSAANLVELTRQIIITPTYQQAQERVYADVNSLISTTTGLLQVPYSTNVTPNRLAVPIVRTGNPTSGLICGYRYRSR